MCCFTLLLNIEECVENSKSLCAWCVNRLDGVKVAKAKEWGVECVNVQWLSELVLGNLRALKLPIDPKYKVFGKPDDFAIDRSMAANVMSEYNVWGILTRCVLIYLCIYMLAFIYTSNLFAIMCCIVLIFLNKNFCLLKLSVWAANLTYQRDTLYLFVSWMACTSENSQRQL